MALSVALKREGGLRRTAGWPLTIMMIIPLLTMTEVPEVEVHLVPSGGKAGGVGEPPVVAVPPALCNAIFAATGVRLRELPVDTRKLKKA
jgi:CO/xanthine dehydrogenase Mo-binding subunit